MKIFGHPISTCTRVVLMTIAETKTPYEFVMVDIMKNEHKQAPHLARQPFGQVPALQDGDFEMFESRAMARYINEKAHGSLVPSDPRARAQMEQWISIETSDFSGPVMTFILQDILKREQTPEALKAAGEKITHALGVMDKQLAKNEFIAGQSFTLADICFMPFVEYAMATSAKDLFTPHSSVTAWWKRISARPTWKTATTQAA
jgi:glutathione S-transferase